MVLSHPSRGFDMWGLLIFSGLMGIASADYYGSVEVTCGNAITLQGGPSVAIVRNSQERCLQIEQRGEAFEVPFSQIGQLADGVYENQDYKVVLKKDSDMV